MPGGFREFTNEINSKQSNVTKMPTYDNFKKQSFGSASKSPMRSSTKKADNNFGAGETATNLEA